jgi:hypothetical protein
LDFFTRLQAFQKLSKQTKSLLEFGGFDAVIHQQSIENKWFTKDNCRFALSALAKMLDEKSCEAFYQKYQACFKEEMTAIFCDFLSSLKQA